MTTTESRLLSLPRELREEVYKHAMTLSFSPPTRALRVIPPIETDQLYNWTDPPRWQPLNLLLVSHQVRHETLKLISRLESTNSFHATLDIFTSGSVYTPKWTLVNLGIRPKSKLDLHVNLTIVSGEAFVRNHQDSSPGVAFKTLLNLLNRFIFDGPSFLDYKPSHTIPGPFFIDTLSVHVAFKDDYTPDTWSSTWASVFARLQDLARLPAAREYIGRIDASTKYVYEGKETELEAHFDVGPGKTVANGGRKGRAGGKDSAAVWAAWGFPFGEDWLAMNRQGGERGLP
ncbi:unnamed protein product [Zymoseptoria tritici ST99CH_1E4]|uniref:F-box domain-containing protein n=1 Tax=Zymoseptoria tritici ST99CH_1E4 TaxID=1276532 RepID=A0A2H1H074_ZYMTR|nr:unnamed protein product [Zymoseptoria tritici ST99CH_1E4]